MKDQFNCYMKIVPFAFFILASNLLSAQSMNEMQTNKFVNHNISNFLENPTKYSFLCTETSRGHVTQAELSQTGILTIHYQSTWEDGDHSGIASGSYDANTNHFAGHYATNDGRFSGEINFTFSVTGEAIGTWDNDYGTIRISLMNSQKNN